MHFFVQECEKPTTTEEKSLLLRWLRSPRLLLYVTLCLALYLSLLLPAAPAAAQTPVPQAAVPQTLNFVNGVAQVQGAISSNQPQDYLFFGTQGQTVRVQLQSQQIGANFEVTGANSITY